MRDEDGHPIGRAKYNDDQVSSPDGVYLLPCYAGSNHALITADGKMAETVEFETSSAQTTDLGVIVLYGERWLRFAVRDDKGKEIARARIGVFVDGKFRASATADATGRGQLRDGHSDGTLVA